MILAGQLASAEDVKRFRTEAEAAAQLDHPNIVSIFEVGKHEEQHYFSMSYVEGQSLAKRVVEGPLPPREAAVLLRQVAEAVDYAHQRGVIHRDLKPGNILLDRQGQPRVTDFGLAKRMEADSNLTGTGQILGTPSYMPPEQAAARLDQIAAVSDVYSLGAVLYCLLIGRPPFQAASPLETLLQVLEQEPVGPRSLNARLPRDLETICLKCLRKEPGKRYATAAGLAADLGRFLDGEPIRARRISTGERALKWVKRRPAVAALSAAVVIILAVGSLVAVEMHNSDRATGLVDALVSADVAQVPQVVAELDGYRHRATPALVALAARTPTSQDERRAQLHARLALVAHDERQVAPLVEELLSSHVSYTGVIRNQLASYQHRFRGDLWDLLHDVTNIASRRFRAGLALATYATNSEQWTPTDIAFLVEQLVAANPEYQPRLREYLRPLDNRLLDELERIFADPKATESQQLSAANALADFAGKDTVRLASLLSAATPGQYEILYPLVAEVRAGAARQFLEGLVRELPAADLPQLERVALGRRRAGAAITLLRQGERESILNALRVEDDPESLTQFVHRCRARGILPVELLDCVKRADALRQTKTGAARRTDDGVLYGLLLALGEFELADLPKDHRDAFVEQLANWYANDRSSAIHGAAGWLLRHWQQDELARKVDQTPVSYAPDREWYTLKFVVPPSGGASNVGENSSPTPTESGTTFYVTFVVFPAGEYVIGSALDDADRLVNDEPRHPVRLTRPISVSDREITWEQYNSFDDRYHHDLWEKQFGHTLTAEEPAFGVSWHDAAAYCRWLTKCAGMAEDDQAYADPASLDRERFPADPDPRAHGAPRNWPLNLEKRGFRLPTEAEWEMVGRGGTITAYSFGNDVRLLRHYAWFLENAERWMHAVGGLRPNPRGLFDIHGNLNEWCHNWYVAFSADAPSEDPTGPAEGLDRVYRGGVWGGASAECQSANRVYSRPSMRSGSLGFRVAIVPFSQASEPASQAASNAGSGSREAERPAAQ
ncbi:MAG TPA: bifunctional serine/threonine-protein kinase/formylglycine-generating enzyme family protein, partial [Pirellulales bacterium]|nr:bifunctional serine/threonine-protein kinase/formylglycine-generating enzyme family protein [Pirellulales bacterium]